jgi:uncharacterized membrane protein YphA (DoxX/SURF4 family)
VAFSFMAEFIILRIASRCPSMWLPKKVPLPDVAVTSTGAVLILGGASILLGVKPKYGAAALAGFLLGISPVMQ